MLYREIIAVCSQIHTKYTNTLCGQNVEFGLWGPRRFLLNAHQISSPGIKLLGREVDEFPSSIAVVKNEWIYTSTSPHYMLS